MTRVTLGELRSPRPPVAGVLRHIAMLALLADVLFFVVAMALGGVDGNLGRAAGSLLLSSGTGLMVFFSGFVIIPLRYR